MLCSVSITDCILARQQLPAAAQSIVIEEACLLEFLARMQAYFPIPLCPYTRYRSDCRAVLGAAEISQEEAPLILYVDATVAQLPLEAWDAIGMVAEVPRSEMSCMQNGLKALAGAGDVKPRTGYFIIDPAEVLEELCCNDVFIYLGHGERARQLLRQDELQHLELSIMVLDFELLLLAGSTKGASQASLASQATSEESSQESLFEPPGSEPAKRGLRMSVSCQPTCINEGVMGRRGDFESFGLASSALLGGAPLVLGAQWDVLGGDLDRLASRLLQDWLKGVTEEGQAGKEPPSSAAEVGVFWAQRRPSGPEAFGAEVPMHVVATLGVIFLALCRFAEGNWLLQCSSCLDQAEAAAEENPPPFRTIAYASVEHALQKFRRLPAQRLVNPIGAAVAGDAFNDPALGNVSEGVTRGVLLAHMYLWGLVPAKALKGICTKLVSFHARLGDVARYHKVEFFRPNWTRVGSGEPEISPQRESVYLARVWEEEMTFLKVPAMSDCNDFILRSFSLQQASQDAKALCRPAVSVFVKSPCHSGFSMLRLLLPVLSLWPVVVVVLLLLRTLRYGIDRGVAGRVHRDGSAAAHLEVVALLLLLAMEWAEVCRGPLDFWFLGAGSPPPQAHPATGGFPGVHEGHNCSSTGRANGCLAIARRSASFRQATLPASSEGTALHPRRAAVAQLWLGRLTVDPVASDPYDRNLPTCHYERQRLRSTGLRLQSLRDEGILESCQAAPRDKILLVLPVWLSNTEHLTSALIFFQGALSWFHGPTGRKVLASLWRAADLESPPSGLQRNTTEVLFAPSPSEGSPAQLKSMVFLKLFGLLSDMPLRSLLRAEPCSRAAIQLRIPGADCRGLGLTCERDLIFSDVSAIRYYKVEKCPRRNVTNLPSLDKALRQKGRGLLSLVTARMQDYPLLHQLQLMLFRTQVLIATFGATLAWTPFLQSGSFVIELHPGPPESLMHFGSCWTQPPAMYRLPQQDVPAWDMNPRSEWGSWAQAAHVHHACVAAPPAENARCFRKYTVDVFEVPEFETDVTTVVALALDAASKLSSRRGAAIAPP
ncbi:hypothetical protein AK812_SmicGene11180 [Symbiodinium microadriaticum]|uniref:Uncharacterized protein n=1 Tax=Symbiodinium microadriaticum TaxID=2951 RepID=A0A1Q9EDZ1_SYMMI|nr:hypothetical protein AK812_SmicGene11180 [Symbiodinium microadriaticum]